MMNSANAKANRIGRSVVGPFIKVGGGGSQAFNNLFSLPNTYVSRFQFETTVDANVFKKYANTEPVDNSNSHVSSLFPDPKN